MGLPVGTTYALPETLGAEPETIARVVVTMSIEALRSMTIIDTPGLASANVAYSAATRELLAIDDASRNAVSDSDAVVFVFPREQPARTRRPSPRFAGPVGDRGPARSTRSAS